MAKSKDITAARLESRANKQPGSCICIAVYINPGNSMEAKRYREQTFNELECALKICLTAMTLPEL